MKVQKTKKTSSHNTNNSIHWERLYRCIRNRLINLEFNLPTLRHIKRLWIIFHLNLISFSNHKFPLTITQPSVLDFIAESSIKIFQQTFMKCGCISPTFTSIYTLISVKGLQNQGATFLWLGGEVSGLSTISTICMLSKMSDSQSKQKIG